MDKSTSDHVKHALGGNSEKPAKKIDRIEHKKSHNGDHIFTHKHTSPEHHPDETHTKRGNAELIAHMMQNAGDPNETADPAAGAADPTADPAATAGGAADPTATTAATPPDPTM